MIRCARAIRDSETLAAHAVRDYGRGIAINVGAYPNGLPDEHDAPFLHLFAAATENEMLGADETFLMHGVFGACPINAQGERVIVIEETERTATANGLAINGGNLTVENTRDEIISVIRASECGAAVKTIRRVENDLSHFPLEWAEFEIEFYDPETLN